MLLTPAETADLIRAGKILALAAEESLLRQLPKGQWIGGTIPYFMTEKGGLSSRTHIFVTELPDVIEEVKVVNYSLDNLQYIPEDAPDNGLSLIIIPATSPVHVHYAQNAPTFQHIFMKPIIGWIAGTHLEDLGKITPKAFNGQTGEILYQKTVVMHLTLPPNKMALVNIINLFEQGDGDEIMFEHEGFSVNDCLINGEKRNFADYLLEKQVDIKYPLVADYCGAMVNVSFQNIDTDKKQVNLYAPVFSQVKYKLAHPLIDYVSNFESALPKDLKQPIFACNCILNYLYSELEGKKTASIIGPITFGEIAYQLLNQTLVYAEIQDLTA